MGHLVMVADRRLYRAVEPPATQWVFPTEPPGRRGRGTSTPAGGDHAGADELVGVGADLEPGTVLAAYRSGTFPMPVSRSQIGWWSPDPRGIIPLDGLKVSRSLRRSCRRYDVRVDTAFEQVLEHCADRRRPGGWINPGIKAAYTRLHHLGWVHSVEAWDDQGQLAGGLYGVAVGGLFAGESMFHIQPDASKVALVGLVELLDEAGGVLLDVQWATDHLKSLGAVEVSRAEYLRRLSDAVTRPQPEVFGG